MSITDKAIFSGNSKEFHETGAPLSKSGKIELAPSFRVVDKWKSLVIRDIAGFVCILCIIILGAVFWTYFFHSPFRVNLDSGELLCSDVLIGLPAFFPAGEILFSQDIEDGSALFLLDLKENKKKSIYCDGMALFPALSRDGATIALTLKSSDTYQIATTPLQNMELSVLTFSNVSSKWPSFSMDGSKIVFQRTRSDKDEILIMNSNGEKQHPLGWEGRRPDYSPTRDEIIFELDVMGISNIFRGTIGEKEIENLTKVTKKEDACFSPSFSPDGDWVLFHRKNKGLWVMKSDGTKQNKILAENFATMMGRISPDGKYLAVCAGNGPSKGNLYLYTLSSPAFGSQLQQTGQIASRFPLKPRVVPKLYINAIPWADVILNGELKGTTPLTLYNVPVNAVIVLKYELYEKTFKVEQLKENRLSYDFPSQSR